MTACPLTGKQAQALVYATKIAEAAVQLHRFAPPDLVQRLAWEVMQIVDGAHAAALAMDRTLSAWSRDVPAPPGRLEPEVWPFPRMEAAA